MDQIDDLVQDRKNSIATALELLQSFTKPSKWKRTSPAPALWMKAVELKETDILPIIVLPSILLSSTLLRLIFLQCDIGNPFLGHDSWQYTIAHAHCY